MLDCGLKKNNYLSYNMRAKLITCFFLFLFFNNSLNCQTESDNLNLQNEKTLNQRIIYRNFNDSLSKEILLLERKNELLNTSLKSNSYTFDGISSYLTVITIILTILAIFVPILTYIFLIKPYKKLKRKMKNIEQEIESKFDLFYKNYEKKKFKTLINQLKENHNYKDLVSFMNTTNYKNYDDSDFNIVVEFLKKDIEIEDLYSLHHILNFKLNNISTLFYKETFESEKNNNYRFAIEYLVNDGKDDFFPFLKKQIINSFNGHNLMLDILEYTEYYYLNSESLSKKNIANVIIKKYFNNKEICQSLELKKLPDNRKNIFIRFKNDLYESTLYNKNPFIKETEYYNLYLKGIIKDPPSFLVF